MGQNADPLIIVPSPPQFLDATGISWCTISDSDSGLVVSGFSDDGKEAGRLTAGFSGGIELDLAAGAEQVTFKGSISASSEYGYEVVGQEVGQAGHFVIHESDSTGNPDFTQLTQNWAALADSLITVGYALDNGAGDGSDQRRACCRTLAAGVLLEGVNYLNDPSSQEWSRLGDAALAYLSDDCGSASA
ncbi:hypothetical protein HTZ77_06905 [Nonomuraea sp. SMC257]|uniref:Uncharacterized protein n=1 Tax=Nonomuraea montanisoli TaxID=2741721 RepID=A0A7Y6I639_9ACTN|nr:hypothetical protein [Nonomuraea montanisoli]NUW31149.1 hypothetical protein [Nonomuraea montanisoli]